MIIKLSNITCFLNFYLVMLLGVQLVNLLNLNGKNLLSGVKIQKYQLQVPI